MLDDGRLDPRDDAALIQRLEIVGEDGIVGDGQLAAGGRERGLGLRAVEHELRPRCIEPHGAAKKPGVITPAIRRRVGHTDRDRTEARAVGFAAEAEDDGEPPILERGAFQRGVESTASGEPDVRASTPVRDVGDR